MSKKKKLFLGLWFLYLVSMSVLGSIQLVLAEEDEEAPLQPLEISLISSRLEAKIDETVPATLVLQNNSSFTLTNVIVKERSVFTIESQEDISDIFVPFSGEQVQFDLKSDTTGKNQMVFAISYEWEDSGEIRQYTEVVSEEINILPKWSFDWPGFLIPLLAGATISLLVGRYTDWRKEKQEIELRQEQAQGVVLALLHAADKNVHWPNPELVDYKLWEEVVIKGHLYPSLNQFGIKIKNPGLSKQLIELFDDFAEYNERNSGNNLTESYVDELKQKLRIIISSLGSK